MIKEPFRVTLEPVREMSERKIVLLKKKNNPFLLRAPKNKSIQQKIESFARANENIFKIKAMQITNRQFLHKMKSADQKAFKLPQLIRKKSPHSYIEEPRVPLESLGSTTSSKMYFQGTNFRSRVLSIVASKFSTFCPHSLPKTNLDEFSFHKQSQKEDSNITQALWKTKGMLVCIKPLKIKQEYLIDLRHKRFLKLYAVLEISRQTYLVAGQQAKYSLKNLIEEFGSLEQQLVRRIVRQIAEGLKELHYHKIYHNNLSLDNIYYDKQGNVMIDVSSFSPSNKMQAIESYISNHSNYSPNPNNKSVFTENDYGVFINYYIPPQSLIPTSSRIFYTNKDIWQLGCLTLELLHGMIDKRNRNHPYNFTVDQVMKNNISTEAAKLIEQIKQEFQPIDFSQESDISKKQFTFSDQAEFFIQNCFIINSEDRPDIWEISKFAFLRASN